MIDINRKRKSESKENLANGPRYASLFTAIESDFPLSDKNTSNCLSKTKGEIPSPHFSSDIMTCRSQGVAVERKLEQPITNSFLAYLNKNFLIDEKENGMTATPGFHEQRWKNNRTHGMCKNMKFFARVWSKRWEASSSDPFKEVCLCTISINEHGLLSVSPDFLKNDKIFYTFEIGKETYEYTVENASLPLSKEVEEKEILLFKEFYKRLFPTLNFRQHDSKILETIPAGMIGIPDPFTLRTIINGEIVSAKNFETTTCMYLHYEIHLPQCWRVESNNADSLLSSNTQFSVREVLYDPYNDNETNVFNFSCPFDIPLLTNSLILPVNIQIIILKCQF